MAGVTVPLIKSTVEIVDELSVLRGEVEQMRAEAEQAEERVERLKRIIVERNIEIESLKLSITRSKAARSGR